MGVDGPALPLLSTALLACPETAVMLSTDCFLFRPCHGHLHAKPCWRLPRRLAMKQTKGRFSRPGSPKISGGQVRHMMMHHSLPHLPPSPIFSCWMQNARHVEAAGIHRQLEKPRSAKVPQLFGHGTEGDVWNSVWDRSLATSSRHSCRPLAVDEWKSNLRGRGLEL